MNTKSIIFITLFSTLSFLLPTLSQAAANKTVTVPGDATYTGTYNYLGERNGFSSYKHSSQNIYLYVDNYLGAYGNIWVLANALVTNPGSEVKYYQWPDSYPTIGDPGDTQWWDVTNNCDGGNCMFSITIVDVVSGVAPTVSTESASLVTTTSGTMNGNIVADGGAATDRGFVYSSSDATPTIGEGGVTQITKGTGAGVFSESIGSLTAGGTYYYQAYGHNTYGTSYGGVKSFTTPTTSQPNKILSGATTPSAANGIYIWIGNYYDKPAWQHQTLNYYIYYSVYKPSAPWNTQLYWYLDDELKNDHGANDYFFDHTDAASCPSSGWIVHNGTGVGTLSVVDYPNITFASGSSYAPGNPTANSVNNIIGRFTLSSDLAGAALTAVAITVSGSRTNISNLKLWSSTDATFNSGSDTQLKSQADGATVTFSGISSAISTSGTYYFITADLAVNSAGTIALTIGSQANLTISGGAIASGFSSAALTSGTLTITAIPEINIQGNSTTIPAGDISPSFSDHSDFGNADITGGTVVRTFTIQNLGGGTLTLSGSSPYVAIGGIHAADFSITATPSSSIAGGSSTTFQTTFNPSAAGLRSAFLTIANNDADESLYDFSIQGTGIAAIAFTDGSGFTPTITPNTTNQAVCRFSLTADGAGATLTAVSLKLVGTRTGLSNLKLWTSTDAIFNSGADTQIGSTVAADPGDGNSVTFSSFSSAVSSGGTYYFLTADVAPSPTGTVQGVIVQNSNLTVSSGTLSGTITNAVLSLGASPLPVELTSFTASVTQSQATLRWLTATEVNNYGFEVERRKVDESMSPKDFEKTQRLIDSKTQWLSIGFIPGAGTSNSPKEYSFTDANVSSGTYVYRLKQIDNNGTYKYSSETEVMLAAPKVFALYQNYPNPFNPSTVISYQLPVKSMVDVRVFDVMGREVATLVNKVNEAGSYEVKFDASRLSSGVYFYKLAAGSYASVKKLLLMK